VTGGDGYYYRKDEAMSDDAEKIRVLLVDDDRLSRKGVEALLRQRPEFTVIEGAESLPEAIRRIQEQRPDVILMDIILPGANGIEASRSIKKDYPDLDVIIVSRLVDESSVLEAVKAGATGYLPKTSEPEDLYNAIRVVHSGGSLIHPSLARKVLEDYRHLARRPPHEPARPASASALRELSDRELEVLQAVSEGHSNKEIADKLFISEKTVKAHLRSIFRKLEVSDRAHAVAYAMRRGWVE